MPKLSIITINLNNCEGLSRTINSVIEQTFMDYEYIIIDGGSKDGSVDIIKKYENKINNWISEEDRGIYSAMNKGIKNATGEYCLFLNSGDYLYSPTVLESVFRDSPISDLICCLLNIEKADGSDPEIYSIDTERITNRYMFVRSLPHPSTLIKKELFGKYGLYDESFKIAGDYEFFVRVIKKKVKVEINPIILSCFNNGGVSNTQLDMVNAEQVKVQKKYFPILYILHSLLK